MAEPDTAAEPALTLPPGWYVEPKRPGLLLHATHPGRNGYDARLTLTMGSQAESVDTLERSLERFRLIDVGERRVAGRVAVWRMARYLARGRVPVTMQQWWIPVPEPDSPQRLACLSATVAHRDLDALADGVDEAVRSFSVARPRSIADPA